MLLSILGLAFTLPLLFLIPLFLISNPYNKKDFLSSGNAFSVFTFTLSRFFVTLLMTLRLSGNVYLVSLGLTLAHIPRRASCHLPVARRRRHPRQGVGALRSSRHAITLLLARLRNRRNDDWFHY